MNQWTVPLEWNTGMTCNPCENAALMVCDSSQNLHEPCVVSYAIFRTNRTK